MKWVALSSYSGSELISITNNLDRVPNKCYSNNIATSLFAATIVDKTPSTVQYHEMFNGADLITLHGWNRIIPDEIVNQYNIYNVHPGDVVNYPELKGKDPQQKAIDLGLTKSGVVIHKCTPELDGGEVVAFMQTNINNDIDEVTNKLRNISIELWSLFLMERL